jgi:hypothetical protein
MPGSIQALAAAAENAISQTTLPRRNAGEPALLLTAIDVPESLARSD